jgi:DNA-directed RNA polymerase alpha subunit
MTNKKQIASDFDALPGVAAPARRALANAGYTRLAQLTKTTKAELMQLHGMGPKAMGAIKKAMREQGLAFQHAAKTNSRKKVK